MNNIIINNYAMNIDYIIILYIIYGDLQYIRILCRIIVNIQWGGTYII